MSSIKVARRDFLAVGIMGAFSLFVYGLLREKAEEPLLRPPGAQDEERFQAKCIRCQECVRACLTECLEPAGREYGAAAMMSPRFNPALGKCEYELCGRACAAVCPVGAIRDVPDKEVRIGTAAINRSKCIAWAEGKDCLVCQERCSYQAIEFDQRGRPSVIAEKCTGCGACQNTCVTCPDPAIVVYPSDHVPTNGQRKRSRNG
jgi:ferredoxin